MNLNQVQIIGRVTRKPEVRKMPSGTSICAFSMATNRTYTKDDQKVEETEFHNIVAFGKQADTIAQYVGQGQELYVQGRLKTSTYEKDGQKHYKTDIILEGFQFGQRAKGDVREAGARAEKPAVVGEGADLDELDLGNVNVDDIPF